MIPAILNVLWWTDRNGVPIPDAQSAEAVRAFLPCVDFDPGHLYAAILKYQEKIRADQLHARHQRELAATRQAMADVPQPPADLAEWIGDNVLRESRYLMYQYTGKKRQTAFCTHCRSFVDAEGLRHQKPARCPACGTQATALSEGRISKYGFTDHTACCVIQRYHGMDIVARHFEIRRIYEHDTFLHRLTFTDRVSETVRSIWRRNGKTVRSEDYQMGVYKHNERNGFDWMPYTDAPYPPCRLYGRGLAEELRATWAEYAGLDAFARGRYLVKLDGYLAYWAKHPDMEYMVKGGLYRLAAEIAEMQRGYYGEPKIHAPTLRQHAHELVRLNGGYHALLAMEALDKAGIRCDPAEVVRFTDRNADYNAIPQVLEYTALKRVNDYQQKYKSRELRELLDYWRMERALGANLKDRRVLFPEHLDAAHDAAVKAYNKQKDEIILRGFAEAARRAAERFSFAADGLVIVVPESSGDLAAEGKALGHCVRTYGEKMAKGETVIVFVRKADRPDVPFYTMEILNGRVAQLRGKYNCSPTPDVARFEKKFCAACHIAPRAA